MNNDIFVTLNDTMLEMWAGVIAFLPTLLMALVVVLVGWIIANILKKLTIRLFRSMKINEALASAGVDALLERAGLQLRAGVFMGRLIKWFVIAVFLVVALDILNLQQATVFVQEVVVHFLPQVIVALLILLIAAVIANVLSSSVVAAIRAATNNEKKANLFGKFAYGAVLTVAVLAALSQIGVASDLILILFAGMVFATSLALGLAFGLGGKETASRYLDSVARRD